MVLVVAGIYLLAFVLCARAFAKREGYYSTVVVFGIGCFIYYLAIPVEMAITGADRLPQRGTVISESTQLQIVVLGTIAFLFFVIGYWRSGFSPIGNSGSEDVSGKTVPPGNVTRGAKVPISVLVLGVVSVVLLLLLFSGQLRSSLSSYKIAYGTTYGNPLYSLFCQYAVLSLGLVSAVLLCRQRARFLTASLCIVPVMLWGIFTFDKNPMFLGVLALAVYFRGDRSRKPWVLLVALCGAAVMLPAILMFSIYRGGGSINLNALGFSMLRVDPAGPMVPLVDVLENTNQYIWGSSYLDGLCLFVPKVLWSGRPLDLAESYARNNMIGWLPGQGMGYSLLAEAYVNCGIIGVVIQYSMIGWLWGKAWRFILRFFGSAYCNYGVALYYVVGFYVLVLMHRGTIGGSAKSLLQLLLPLALAHLVFDRRLGPAEAVGIQGHALRKEEQL